MRLAIGLFIVALALLLAPARAERDRPAAAQSYADSALASGLLELAPDSHLPSLVRQGRRRAEVGPLDVAMALPGALLGRDVPTARSLGSSLFSLVLLIALGCSFAERLLRRGLGRGRALVVTFVLVAGTSIALALRRGDAIAVATLALWLLVDELSTRELPPRGLKLGLLGAILIAAEPAFAGAAVAVCVLALLRRRGAGSSLLGFGFAALSPILVALVAVRWWEARIALATEPSHALFHGLYGLLLSPGRSVFVYSPLALVGVLALPTWWARERSRAEATLVVSVLALVGIASRADWHGEPGFGPWLVLPLLPLWGEAASTFLLGDRAKRAWFALAAAAGLFVQVAGVAVDAEAWPKLVADVRAATGAPGWFLDPAADLEFIPQLSPVVGQITLWRLSHGGAVVPPPFSLVVGSDQAEPAGKNSADLAFEGCWTRFDKTALRPNLAWVSAPPLLFASLAFFVAAIGVASVVGRRPPNETSEST